MVITMKKFLSVTLCLLMVAALVFSGCTTGGGTAGGAATTAGGGAAATTAKAAGGSGSASSSGAKKNVELQTWANAPVVNFFKSQIGPFSEAYPDYTLVVADAQNEEHDSVKQTRISAGNVDIVCFQQFGKPQEDWNKKYYNMPLWQQFIEEGLLLDLTNYDFTKNYIKKCLDDNSYNGKYYCLPTGTVALNGMYYSVEIFDKLGLSVPETWDEFINCCETIKNAGYGVITAGGADQWPLNMYASFIITSFYTEDECRQIGKDMLMGKAKYTDPFFTEAYKAMEQFASYLEPGVSGIMYADIAGRLVQGHVAMMCGHIPTTPYIVEADPNFKFGYFVLPGKTKPADGKPKQFAIKYDLTLCVASNAPNKDGALAFLEFFSRKDVYTAFVNASGFSPTQPDITVASEFMNSLAPHLVAPQMDYGNYSFSPKGIGEYGGAALNFFYLDVLGGPFSAKELAEKAAQDYTDALAALDKL